MAAGAASGEIVEEELVTDEGRELVRALQEAREALGKLQCDEHPTPTSGNGSHEDAAPAAGLDAPSRGGGAGFDDDVGADDWDDTLAAASGSTFFGAGSDEEETAEEDEEEAVLEGGQLLGKIAKSVADEAILEGGRLLGKLPKAVADEAITTGTTSTPSDLQRPSSAGSCSGIEEGITFQGDFSELLSRAAAAAVDEEEESYCSVSSASSNGRRRRGSASMALGATMVTDEGAALAEALSDAQAALDYARQFVTSPWDRNAAGGDQAASHSPQGAAEVLELDQDGCPVQHQTKAPAGPRPEHVKALHRRYGEQAARARVARARSLEREKEAKLAAEARRKAEAAVEEAAKAEAERQRAAARVVSEKRATALARRQAKEELELQAAKSVAETAAGERYAKSACRRAVSEQQRQQRRANEVLRDLEEVQQQRRKEGESKGRELQRRCEEADWSNAASVVAAELAAKGPQRRRAGAAHRSNGSPRPGAGDAQAAPASARGAEPKAGDAAKPADRAVGSGKRPGAGSRSLSAERSRSGQAPSEPTAVPPPRAPKEQRAGAPNRLLQLPPLAPVLRGLRSVSADARQAPYRRPSPSPAARLPPIAA